MDDCNSRGPSRTILEILEANELEGQRAKRVQSGEGSWWRTGGVHREWKKRGKMGLWRGSTTGWDEAGELELNYGKESESEDRVTDSKENVSGVLMPETHKWDEEGCGRRSLSSLGTGAERRLSATKLEIRLGY